MLGTSATPYDLRFRFLEVPVRVHPFFWLVSAIMGSANRELGAVVIWIGCVFVSILVHEYGHALMAKRFHGSPSIVLYGLGGLCFSHGERGPGERLAVLFAGPGAGFVLCAVVLLLTSLALGISPSEHLAVLQDLLGLSYDAQQFAGAMSRFPSFAAVTIYLDMIWVNLCWGLVNLFPIWPLDGGQATQVVLAEVDRRRGVRRSHIVSLVTAGVLAVLAATLSQQNKIFLTVFFGMLAFLNYQVLQSLHEAHSYGVDQDDDWWKR
jgi:membrane-associated protease RseP (regulator of RpoE activity)